MDKKHLDFSISKSVFSEGARAYTSIMSGPYSVVRHPSYLGVVFMEPNFSRNC